MSKSERITVSLGFVADTRKVTAQLNTLKRNLTEISHTKFGIEDTEAMRNTIRQASAAAADLNLHLKAATNQDTGRIDFSKFSSSLKKSNIDLVEYASHIRQVGVQGEKAFLQIANAIVNSEVPLRRTNKLVTKFWDNLKRNIGWEIASRTTRGIESAIGSAVGYAQDLNKTLNDIRIVTEATSDEMASFAKEANKAAKALSTTTNEYSKASLIYFQQGLSEKEVKKRADITIKMANVVGESAEKVSSQLTAVWNNFAKGAKSLEYYADVMTALGAATASSTDEISNGLNKFASVADTVGLSYEYAASALATVTSTTRESADVVGTAFKTLFARIQDLELGKTLDDGTTIGKYAQSMAAVGINIKDASGNLKTMDTLLTEMAEKWDTLSKDSQVALAQNVAGVRQYTQLVALLDNWDFFQSNLQESLNATGTLNEQAKIYAESWEAARDRVQASLETLYAKLLEDEAFIKMLDNFSKFIDGIDYLVDRLGGLEGVLANLGLVFTKYFSNNLAQGLRDLGYSLNMTFFGGDERAAQAKIDQMKKLSMSFQSGQGGSTSSIESGSTSSIESGSTSSVKSETSLFNRQSSTASLQQQYYQYQINLQETLLDKTQNFTEIEEARINSLTEQYRVMGKAVFDVSEALDGLAKKQQNLDKTVESSYNQIIGRLDLSKEDKEKPLSEEQKQIILGKNHYSSFLTDEEKSEELELLKQARRTAKNNRKNLLEEYTTTASKFFDPKEIKKPGGITKDMIQKKRDATEDETNRGELEKLLENKNDLELVDKDIEDTTKSINEIYQEVGQKVQERQAALKAEKEKYAQEVAKYQEAAIKEAVFEALKNALKDVKKEEIPKIAEKKVQALEKNFNFNKLGIKENSDFQKLISAETTDEKREEIFGEATKTKKEAEDELTDSNKQFSQTRADVVTTTEKQIEKSLQHSIAMEQEVEVQERITEELDNHNKASADWATTIVSGTDAVMGLVSAVNSLKSAWDAVQNPNLTGWQKITAVATSLGVSIWPLARGMKALSSIISKETISKNENTVATKANAVAEKELADSKEQTADAVDQNAEKELTDSKEQTADAADQNAEKINKETGAKKKGFSVKDIGTKVGKKLKAAAPLLTLAAIVTVAAVSLDALDKAWNKDAIAAKKAAKAAAEASEAYEQCKNAYKDLQSTLESYSSKKDSLKELVKDTLEFKEALVEANDEAWKLIQQYSDLKYEINNDGLIEIDEESYQAVKEAEFAKINQQRTASIAMTQYSKNADLKAKQTEYNREIAKDNDWSKDSWNKTGQGAAWGTAAGAIAAFAITALAIGATGGAAAVPLMIAAIAGGAGGALTGSQIGSMFGRSDKNKETADEEKLLKKMAELYGQQGSSIFKKEELEDLLKKDEGSFGEDWVKQNQNLLNSVLSQENLDATKDLIKEMYDNTQAQIAANKLLAQQAVEGNKWVENSEYENVIDTILGAERQALIDAELARLEEEGVGTKGINKAQGKNSKAGEALLAQWAAAAGLNPDEIKLDNVVGTDTNRSFTYRVKNEDGTWSDEVKEIDLSAILQVLANQAVDEQQNKQGTEYAKKLRGVSATAAGVAQGILSNDFSAITVGALQGQELSEEQIAEIIRVTGQTEESINETLKKAREAYKATLDGFDADTQDVINDLTGNISWETAKAFGTFLDSIDDKGAAVGNFTEALTKLTNGLDDKKKDAFLSQISTIDFSNKEAALNQLQIVLEDLNIEVDKSSESWIKLLNAFNSFQEGVSNFSLDKVRKELSDISSLVAKIKIGEVISDDEFKKIRELNADFAKFFVMTAEGYAYLGGGGNVYDALTKNTDSLSEKYKLNKEAYNAINGRKDQYGDIKYGTLTEGASVEQLKTYARGFTDDTAADDEVLAAVGITREALQEYIDNNNQEKLENFFKEVAAIQTAGDSGLYSDPLMAEKIDISENVQTTSELVDWLNEGKISVEAYKDMLPTIQERTKVLTDKWQTVVDKVRETVSSTYEWDETLGKIEKDLKKLSSLGELTSGTEAIDLLGLEMSKQDEKTNALIGKRTGLQSDIDFAYNRLLIDAGTHQDIKTAEGQRELLEKRQQAVLDIQNRLSTEGESEELNKLLTNAQKDLANTEKYIKNYNDSLNAYADNEQAILESIIEQREFVYNAYAETMEKEAEKLDIYTDRMDANISSLSEYKRILELTGKTSSSQMKTILDSASATSEARMKVATEEYEQYKAQADKAYKELLALQGQEGTEEYNVAVNHWKQTAEMAEEAQSEMLEKTQAWGEAMKAQVEYDMKELGKSLEKAFTEKAFAGGITFDELTTSMDRVSTLQEEYLTNTNKIYEISKLTRQVQSSIDSSTSSISKQKLKAFMDETKQLQNNEKLSTHELNLQQKKYELLLAEIALQDAQDAKSVARLTRTADGGFGYIYTADENQIAEAQQKYEDAENALYNARLEGANNYTQKSIQVQQELIQSLEDLNTQYMTGQIASEEEYYRRREETIAYYNQMLSNYSELYQLSVSEDISIVDEAWSTGFSNMISNADTWSSSMTEYIVGIDEQFSIWKTTIESIESSTGLSENGIQAKVGEIKTATDNLLKSLLGEDGKSGLVGGLQQIANTIKDQVNTALTDYLNKLIGIEAEVNRIINGGEGAGDNIGPSQEDIDKKKNAWQTLYDSITDDSITSDEINTALDTVSSGDQGYREVVSRALQATKGDNNNIVAKNFEIAANGDTGHVPAADFESALNSEEWLNGKGKVNGTGGSGGSGEDSTQATIDTVISKIQTGDLKSVSANDLDAFAENFRAKDEHNSTTVTKRQAEIAMWLLNSGQYDQIEKNAILTGAIAAGGFTDTLIDRIKSNVTSQAAQHALDSMYGFQDKSIKWIHHAEPFSGKDLMSKFLANDGKYVKLYRRKKKNGELARWYDQISQDCFFEAYLPGFDTGGYTGSWGPEGKMAMLHEKEIVLNKEDTSNLLESIALLRSILATIDLQAANSRFNSLMSSSYFTPTTSETLEQNVHIEASFPAVTDHNEIEEALNTLVNRASQYANRK